MIRLSAETKTTVLFQSGFVESQRSFQSTNTFLIHFRYLYFCWELIFSLHFNPNICHFFSPLQKWLISVVWIYFTEMTFKKKENCASFCTFLTSRLITAYMYETVTFRNNNHLHMTLATRRHIKQCCLLGYLHAYLLVPVAEIAKRAGLMESGKGEKSGLNFNLILEHQKIKILNLKCTICGYTREQARVVFCLSIRWCLKMKK